MDICCPNCGSHFLELRVSVPLNFIFNTEGEGMLKKNVSRAREFYCEAFTHDASYYERSQDCLVCRLCGRKLYPLLDNICRDNGTSISAGYKLKGAFLTEEKRDKAIAKMKLLDTMGEG